MPGRPTVWPDVEPPISLQVDEQGGDVGRVDAADPAGLAERAGPDPVELLAGLGAELGDRPRSRSRRGWACASRRRNRSTCSAWRSM